ncbi:MAG: hypothetical protein QM784_08860 [Polyangiaceae bacterium]
MTQLARMRLLGAVLLGTSTLMCNEHHHDNPVAETSRGGDGSTSGGASTSWGNDVNAGTNAYGGVSAYGGTSAARSNTSAGSTSIWESPPYGWANQEHPYQACEGTAVATGEAPVISDFNGQTLHVLANEGRNGAWYASDDGSSGRLTVELDSGALHVTSENWSIWGAGLGVAFAPSVSAAKHCYYDASRYAGIRFRARGSGTFRITVGSFDNYPVSMSGKCNQPGTDCFDWPGGNGRLSDEWKTFEFPFCALTTAGWSKAQSPLESNAAHHLLYSTAQRTSQRTMAGRLGLLYVGFCRVSD